MNPTDYFILQYQGGTPGCPVFLHGDHHPQEFEWKVYEPIAPDLEVKNDYVFTVTDPAVSTLNFDFYGADSWFVSGELLALCRDFNVRFRAVPLKIMMRGKGQSDHEFVGKQYFIFLPCEDVALLDRESSEYTDETVLETGEPMMHKFFPQVPVYSEITHFVPRSQPVPALFRCLEIFELVCTQEFKAKALEKKLQGIKFIPLDDSYHYDAWSAS